MAPSLEQQLAEVNGVIIPSKPPAGHQPLKAPKTRPSVSTEDHYRTKTCPICGHVVTKANELRGHFVTCVKTNGNPTGAHWDDNVSIEPQSHLMKRKHADMDESADTDTPTTSIQPARISKTKEQRDEETVADTELFGPGGFDAYQNSEVQSITRPCNRALAQAYPTVTTFINPHHSQLQHTIVPTLTFHSPSSSVVIPQHPTATSPNNAYYTQHLPNATLHLSRSSAVFPQYPTATSSTSPYHTQYLTPSVYAHAALNPTVAHPTPQSTAPPSSQNSHRDRLRMLNAVAAKGALQMRALSALSAQNASSTSEPQRRAPRGPPPS